MFVVMFGIMLVELLYFLGYFELSVFDLVMIVIVVLFGWYGNGFYKWYVECRIEKLCLNVMFCELFFVLFEV